MGFLAPYMLWGAAAAGIPIALHFFFRSRYRTVPWAAMKFLLTSIEQTSRRLRFQELLLLIARVTILILLALALARPLTTSGGAAGKGDAVDAVFVVDTSFSMDARDGAASRLERAKTAALSVIDQLPAHSTVQIITCADRSTLLGPRAPANLDQAKEMVQGLQISHLASNLLPGLEEARSVLERGQATNRELYIFSDMQKLGWDQQKGETTKFLQEIKGKATIYLVRCGRTQPKNVAVAGISPQSGVPRPGERVGFAVLIRNRGAEPLRDLKVSLTVDDDPKSRESQAVSRLDPGQTRAVTLTGKLGKPGLRVLTATVEHDDLDADNRFDQVVLVREQVNVLLVDGAPNVREPEKSASYYLEHALMPVKDSDKSRYYLQIQKVSPRLASPARLAKQDLCILVNVALERTLKQDAEALPADFVEELAKFVNQGKALMIFAGDHVDPKAYNQIFGEKQQLLPLAIKGRTDFPSKSPLLLDRNSVDLPAFRKFKEDDYYKSTENVEIYRTLELSDAAPDKDGEKKENSESSDKAKANKPAHHVVLRYSNGLPAVVTHPVGAGEVMMFATSADPGWKADSPNPTWTSWPREPMYLPFMDIAVAHLLHGQTHTHNLVAGQTLQWYPRDVEPHSYALLHPGGQLERLGLPETAGDRPVVTANDLSQAGIYYLLATPAARAGQKADLPDAALAKENGMPLAVVPDLRESEDLEALSDAQIDARLGFRPIHVTAGDAAPSFSEIERLNHEWTLWILTLVLLLVLCESVLALWCGRAW
jgi:hypothetical protein